MASIKLSDITGLKNKLFGGGLPAHPKAAATQLLKSNPLEINEPSKNPLAHLQVNPLEFTNIQFPRDLGLQNGMGHYIIFYSISNNKSIDTDKKFNSKIGVQIDSEDIAVGDFDKSTKYNIKKLKTRANGEDVKIGRSAPNSVLTGGLQTHTTVTGGVALYMPPGIKAEYAVETGHSELGLAGMGAQTISRALGAKDTAGQIGSLLEGLGGAAMGAARKLAISTGEALGLGDISGAITKVTATAENNFSEAVFERVQPRSFSYSFDLIARNKDEAQDIQKIIKFFKFHMHPELDPGTQSRFFRVPSEFEIHYAYNDQKNNYLHEISRCVCSNVSVDYGGDSYATFRQFDGEGAAPVQISMSLSFTETTILTKKEIAEGF